MKILIATDGSEFSRAAIEKCCQIAVRPENTEIRILAAFENMAPVAAEPFAISAQYIAEVEAAAEKEAEKFVREAEKQLAECFPGAQIRATCKIVKNSADRAIVEEAENWGADLIVVGSHGRGFWKRMWLGSVSQTVIQHAPCSVLVVRNPALQNSKHK